MSESLYSSGTNMATMIIYLRAHKRVSSRVITFSLVAFCAFWLTPSWREVGPFGFLFFFALFMMLIVSQIFCRIVSALEEVGIGAINGGAVGFPMEADRW